ncbi:MAG TPA: mechanosensitive ion channel domain-containing protein [Holophaga sp.]|nr:mechanosensitive ion channel domain-containing protein [Holophaga sp.]
MKLRSLLPATLFLLLAGGLAAGLHLTRDPGRKPAPKKAQVAAREEAPVDQRPVKTARKLALLVSSPEEKPLAHDAQRVADHEVDLAFADALRRAANLPVPSTPEIRALEARKERQEAAVTEGQRTIARLTKALAATEQKDDIEDQLDVAKAQLELDKDELEATADALEKLGADPGGKIRRLKASFQETEKEEVEDGEGAPARFQPGSLLHQVSRWNTLRRKAALLQEARDEALAKAEDLVGRQKELAEAVEQEREDRESIRAQAQGFAKGARENVRAAGTSRETARATLLTLKHFTEDQRSLADLGKRIQDQRQLGDIYREWRNLVADQARTALHGVIRLLGWILGVVVVVWFADRIFEAVFSAMVAGRKRVGRNLKVVKFAALVVGVLAIAVIVLGTPSQLTTLFGLAGAGLTVALKDFIISFFGWFILVGPKGIHVGDWVEIKGVGGEVIEIGLMRTLLLETGNWNDAGHPTGRIVSFVNSFALEGHFFNFSSAGQWMWDELNVTAPAGRDPYPFIDAIRTLVEARTAANAEKAFKEWELSHRGAASNTLRLEPGISVVPAPDGVQVRVRYITRAQERNELRRELNEAVVELLHGKREA